MLLLSPHKLEDQAHCAYLPDLQRQSRYFLAEDVTGEELDSLLAAGWRKFGPYFFQPACPGCQACTPLRVRVADFRPSRSQRRVLRSNRELSVDFGGLNFTQEIYEIYLAHSKARFGKTVDSLENFLFSFYCPPCPALQVEIHQEDQLIAVGWLDVGETSLSSVYFCFDPEFAHLGPGTFSILSEIEYARGRDLEWYYLGYSVAGNRATAYKTAYQPHETFDWLTRQWIKATNKDGNK